MPDNRHAVVSLPSPKSSDSELWMADLKSGSLERMTADTTTESEPAVSPDGKKLIFASTSEDFNMVEIPLDGGPTRSLLTTSRRELFPAWPPVGEEYAYVTDHSGESEIWIRSRRSSSPPSIRRTAPPWRSLPPAIIKLPPSGSHPRKAARPFGSQAMNPKASNFHPRGRPTAIGSLMPPSLTDSR
jgi:Tol biopolymer transport system component